MDEQRCQLCNDRHEPRYAWQQECEDCLIRLVAIGVGMLNSGQAQIGKPLPEDYLAKWRRALMHGTTDPEAKSDA